MRKSAHNEIQQGWHAGSLVSRPHLFRFEGLAACSTFLGLGDVIVTLSIATRMQYADKLSVY